MNVMNAGDALDQGEIVAGDHLHQPEQRDRRLTDQCGEITDDRDRRGERLDDRLERPGESADLARDRFDEVGDQRADIEVEVVERDRQRFGFGAAVERPVESERPNDAGEAGGLSADGAGPEEQVDVGVDLDARLEG